MPQSFGVNAGAPKNSDSNTDTGSIELKKIGIVGVDEVLLGGIPEGNIMLVEGTPGTGKTTLALEFLYRGAAELGEAGLLISFELMPRKIIRDAKGFGWDFSALEAAGKLKLIYTSPAVLLQELQCEDGVIATQLRSSHVKRVAIDGLTPLRLFSESATGKPFRENLHLLVETLQGFGVTALLTNEIATADGPASHEQFVCDTVICLRQEPKQRGVQRWLEIAKSRGQDFVPGRHTLRIESGSGVRIYPRAYSRPRIEENQPTSCERSSIGVPALDVMLGGGVYDGSITLVVGISGTGKTVSGLQFLTSGAKQGKPGLMVTLDEHPAQIKRNAQTMDLGLQEHLDRQELFIHYDSPLELEIDVHFYQIKELVERYKIKRIVIDSLAAYEAANPVEFRDFLFALATYFKDHLITAYLNYESPELLGISQISEDLKASNAVDNIILLNYVEVSTKLRRAITVPKARGSKPSHDTREYIITSGGVALIDEERGEGASIEAVPQLPFSSYYGVLARSPVRKSPVIEESVVHGQAMPKSPDLVFDTGEKISQDH